MKNNILKWLSDVAGKLKINILILSLIQMLLGFTSVAYALFLRNTIDSATGGIQQEFRMNLLFMLLIVLTEIILKAVSRWLDELSRSSLENRFKARLFSNLLRKNYAEVTALHSGDWLNRLTSDACITASYVIDIIPGVLGMAVKMLGALVMLLVMEPRFAYILIPGGLCLLILTTVFRNRMKKLHKNIQEKDGFLRIFLQERLSSLVIVRTFSAEQQTNEEAGRRMAAHQEARMKRNSVSNICNIGFGIAMDGMYLLGLAYGGIGILSGSVSYGTLTAILQLISQIQSPFANITGYLPKFYAMTASAERLREAEYFQDDCQNALLSREQIQDFYHDDFSALKLKNIMFRYRNHDKEQVLRNLNLTVEKGDYIAFTGHSGCGKSTVLKLIMCLYTPDSGEMNLIRRTQEQTALTSEWHRLFAYVPQGNQLMSGTIREIIAFSDTEKMQEEDNIRRALRISCAEEFIDKLENGIDTVLGERGQGLSEGQMQRIAIARAIFSDNPILLLDEATSSLDENSEKQVLENLRQMTDKTIIIVTHRPKALEICNKILHFTENGTELKSHDKR